MLEFQEGNNQMGPAQRFKEYCQRMCNNRKLILPSFNLGLCAAKEISHILSVNKNIVHINLSKNLLKDEGVEEIMRQVKHSYSIIHLDLQQNNITSKGAKKIFKGLISNNSVISLKVGNIDNIQKNKIGLKAVPKLVELVKTS